MKACEDEDGLLKAVAPPDDAATAERVETLRARLVRARALETTGGYAEGLTLATKVRGEARTLSYAPLQAEAALVEGGLLSASARSVDAEAALAEALRLAIAHDLHAEAAEAAVKRIFVLGDGLSRHEAARRASGAVRGGAGGASARRRLLAGERPAVWGIVFDLAGDDAAAQRHFERTVTLLQRAGTPDPLLAVVHHNLANVDLSAATSTRRSGVDAGVRAVRAAAWSAPSDGGAPAVVLARRRGARTRCVGGGERALRRGAGADHGRARHGSPLHVAASGGPRSRRGAQW